MTRDWRGRATPYVGDELQQLAWVASLAERNDLPLLGLRTSILPEALTPSDRVSTKPGQLQIGSVAPVPAAPGDVGPLAQFRGRCALTFARPHRDACPESGG
jgi:hypothetical protein